MSDRTQEELNGQKSEEYGGRGNLLSHHHRDRSGQAGVLELETNLRSMEPRRLGPSLSVGGQ